MKTEMLTGAAWLWSLAAAGSVTMQPCTSPASQQTTCYEKCGGPRNPSPTAGMFQFKSHPGTCLAADPATKLLITASCNKSDGYQRFNNFGGLLLQGAHSDKAWGAALKSGGKWTIARPRAARCSTNVCGTL